MVKCKNCKSIDVKVLDLNFARRKNEGEPTVKGNIFKKQFCCRTCGSEWYSDPEAEKLYFEYKDLKSRTTLVAQIVKRGEPYRVQYIKPDELMRRKELAIILFDKYGSYLDIDPGEWYDIESDVN